MAALCVPPPRVSGDRDNGSHILSAISVLVQPKKWKKDLLFALCDLGWAIGLSLKISLFCCFNAGKMIGVIYLQDKCKNIMNTDEDQYEMLLFLMIHDIDDYWVV